MKIDVQDRITIDLRGEVEIDFISSSSGLVVRHLVLKNHISDSAIDILLGLLGRDQDDKIVSTISVGTGGDINPATGLDTGARFPPEDDEDEMRVAIFDAPVAHVETDSVDKRITYTAVLKTEEGNSDSINEFGLLSEDGTMLSHFVTPAGGGGRATKFEKTDLLYMVVRWKLIPAIRRS
jgi:hypothetical protein